MGHPASLQDPTAAAPASGRLDPGELPFDTGLTDVLSQGLTVLGLIVIAGLVLARCAKRWRHWGLPSRGGPRRLAGVERLALEPRRAVYVLRCDQHEFLVATSESGVRLLSPIDPSAAGASHRDPTGLSPTGPSPSDQGSAGPDPADRSPTDHSPRPPFRVAAAPSAPESARSVG